MWCLVAVSRIDRARRILRVSRLNMKMIRLFVLALVVASTILAAEVHAENSAVVPVSREARSLPRQEQVLQRAKDNPGPCDVVFIGDSITQGWEGAAPNGGKNVWEKYYGKRKCLNFGVGGDRTQHVLWRFDHGQLD